jgi:predicted PurR-regulated permease PerM
MAILATLAVILFLQWAQEFLVPLVFSILIAYMLNPVINWMGRCRIPRVVAATLVIVALVCGTGFALESLRGQFVEMIERLPAAAYKLSSAVTRSAKDKSSTIQQMQAAANELERATNRATGTRAVPERAATAGPPLFHLREWLVIGSMSAISFIVQAVMVIFLVYFLLLSGETFKRKLVKLVGPSLANRRITVQILSDINHSIQRYLFVLLVTNLMLAVLMWMGLKVIGLQSAEAWAVTAGLVHLIPYFGPLFITVTTGISAFMQYQSFYMMLVTAAWSLIVATFVGMLVTTWMTGKIAKMNPAAVFISLLFWGWLWGLWGLLLGIPITVIFKVTAEHIEKLRPFAEFLGD